jgi:hypothetical protein
MARSRILNAAHARSWWLPAQHEIRRAMSRRYVDVTTLAMSGSDRIRNANLLDLAELTRLLAGTVHAIASYFGRGHFLVLERRDGTLEAACHVDVSPDCSTIDLLVVDPAVRDGGTVQRRMVGVASALCEAYGHPDPSRR